MPPQHSSRLRQFPQFVPASQPVDFVSADLYVELPHGDEAGKSGHFVLGGQDHSHGPKGVWEPEFLDFRETLAQLKFSVAIDARVRDRLVERYFRRPLRNGIVALAAF